MKIQRKRRKPLAEINVVPYIDVMLVLLIIFMVTTPLLTQGVKVDLPKASAKPIDDQQSKPIIISVNSQGQYFLNSEKDANNPIAIQDLATQVTTAMQLGTQQGAPPPPVLIKGDKNVNYGAVVNAMAILQQAGVDKVGLMTDPTDIPPPTNQKR